jgi:hypothetical protein
MHKLRPLEQWSIGTVEHSVGLFQGSIVPMFYYQPLDSRGIL